MAQPSSPSNTLPAGVHKDASTHVPHPHHMNSNADVPIDPSISQASPTYAPYSPYGPGHSQDNMAQYSGHPQQMYGRASHEAWPQYPQHGIPGPYQHPGAPVSQGAQPSTPTSRPGQGQVYSFVPIPGAQQHKRPRRRYEEIERMYKCGWNGCEKAYGTLNHLNAHVTMQSHGTKRTPEEFKEIRKEWKARKREQASAQNAAENEQGQAQPPRQQGGDTTPAGSQQGPGSAYPSSDPSRALPPIGYAPADNGSQSQYGPPPGGMVYAPGNGHMQQYPPGYPNSPYAPQGPVYSPQNQTNPY